MDADRADLHALVSTRVAATRQRYTRGRRQLVDHLLDLDRPVTMPELLAGGAPQSQSSLYRNLAVLEQCGVVRRITSIDENARYELDEELTGHHHHLVCSGCGRVDDIELPGPVETALKGAVKAARRQRGYRVESHRIELIGTCPACV